MAGTMIERITQALFAADMSGHQLWKIKDESVESEWDFKAARATAIAILTAMRPFTEEMDLRQWGHDDREPICMIDRSADEVWAWTIDQILDGA